MNPELKAKWIAALRSGKYAQTSSALRDSVGYCCVGVLADVVDPAGWDEYHAWRNYAGTIDAVSRDELQIEWDVISRLECMNDGARFEDENIVKHTFPEIADYLESRTDI